MLATRELRLTVPCDRCSDPWWQRTEPEVLAGLVEGIGRALSTSAAAACGLQEEVSASARTAASEMAAHIKEECEERLRAEVARREFLQEQHDRRCAELREALSDVRTCTEVQCRTLEDANKDLRVQLDAAFRRPSDHRRG